MNARDCERDDECDDECDDGDIGTFTCDNDEGIS